MSEKVFQNKVRTLIKNLGGWEVKYFACAFTPSGIPDILCCYKGYFVAIEFKDTDGKATDLQILQRDKIRKSGGLSIILYPEDYLKFVEFITLIDNGFYKKAYEMQYEFDSRCRMV